MHLPINVDLEQASALTLFCRKSPEKILMDAESECDAMLRPLLEPGQSHDQQSLDDLASALASGYIVVTASCFKELVEQYPRLEKHLKIGNSKLAEALSAAINCKPIQYEGDIHIG